MMKGVLKNVDKKGNGLKKEESEFKAGAKAVKLLDTLFKEKSDCKKKIDVTEKGSKEDDLKQSMTELSPKMVSLLHCLHEKGYLKKANFMQSNKFYLSCFLTYYSRTFLQGAAEKFGKDHQELLAKSQLDSLARNRKHYRAWTESTQHKFEDTWQEQRPIEIVLGKEKNQMTGLAIAVASMKSGECALLHVGWELGYGKEGSFSFPNVPPMADLIYEVELIGFDETKEGKARGDMTVEERIGAADRRKMEGNVLFKDEKLEEAMQQYEMAIAYMGDDFMFQLMGKYRDMALAVKNPCHLNIAACLIKLKRYEEAIPQCSIVLSEDENNVKAMFRRGKAKAELGQTDAAREDFLKARKYAPEDKVIVKELRLLDEDDKAVYQKQKEIYKGIFGPRPEPKPKQKNWFIFVWQWLLAFFYRLFKLEKQKVN